MRGLPSAGKSFRAKQLLDEFNATGPATPGLIHSTDEFWYKINKPDLPLEYSFNARYLGDAHEWNQRRTKRQIELGNPFVVIDNTNTTVQEMKVYAEYASWQGYEVRIEYPTSPWWLEIAALLADKRNKKDELKDWAKKLEEKSKETHCVPFWAIEKMMWRWENVDAAELLEKIGA